jgi:hypothetical protein
VIIDVSATRVRKDELAPARNETLPFKRFAHRREDVDLPVS